MTREEKINTVHKAKSIKDTNAQKPKNHLSKEKFNEILQYLIKEFPNTFSMKKPKMLKIRIHRDLKEKTNLSANILKHFLSKYCRSKAYKAEHLENAPRYDLEGNIVGHITEQEVKNKLS